LAEAAVGGTGVVAEKRTGLSAVPLNSLRLVAGRNWLATGGGLVCLRAFLGVSRESADGIPICCLPAIAARLPLRTGSVDVIIRCSDGLQGLVYRGREIGPFVVLRSSPFLCLED
jgi:hypothetical protein